MSHGKGCIRALFPGRFQPPHRGHGEVIKWILRICDSVIIAIGSAQESHTFQNPLTAGERVEAIRLLLNDLSIDYNKVFIIPVPDIFMNKVWTRFVEALVPEFDVIVTRNPLVRELFEESGYKVLSQPVFNRAELMGTNIRRIVIEGGNWEQYLTPSVVSFLKSIGFDKRLRAAISRD